MYNIRKLEVPIKVKVAKTGIYLMAKKKGDLKARFHVNSQYNDIIISDVLIVLNLETNLISVRKLEMKGFKIIFENGMGKIIHRNNIAAIAFRKQKLYELEFSIKTTEEGALSSEVVNDTELWHKRLAHLSYGGIQKLKTLVDGIQVEKVNLGPCKICMEGKQVKLPHNNQRHKTTRPLQLVHSDVMGPISPKSYDNMQYIISFIDDFTHFTVIYLMEPKDEVFKYFKMYQAMATAHFNLKMFNYFEKCFHNNLTEEIANTFRTMR